MYRSQMSLCRVFVWVWEVVLIRTVGAQVVKTTVNVINDSPYHFLLDHQTRKTAQTAEFKLFANIMKISVGRLRPIMEFHNSADR